jgi:predicted metal-dependent peptidase
MVAQMKQGGKSVGPIDKHDMGKPLSAEEKQDAEQSLRRIAIEGKLKGNAPGWLIKRIEEMFKPIVNWQNELRAFISPMIKTRQSYNKPHRNSHSLGVYLPHYKKEGVELTVAIDTSGSIGAREMNYFISEVESILKQFPAGSVNAHLLMHHVDVYCKRNSISSSELKDLQIETGGTSHVPVYEEARKLNTKLLVLLTDGYSDFPEIRPHGIQTIAVNTGCESSRKYYPAWIRRVIDVDPAEVRKNKR